MATITYRTTENRAERLKHLAGHIGVSVNKLIDEMATHALASHDAENRFKVRAARGSAAAGLAMLDELDAHFGTDENDTFKTTTAPQSYSLHDSAESMDLIPPKD